MPMTPRDLSQQRPDWRYFAALSIVFAILIVVTAVSFRTEQKFTALHSSSSGIGGEVNVKTVANNTAGN
jgi:hypothetical protein